MIPDRERPGPRGLLFPPSYSRDQHTAAEEEAHERGQEREAERAPADDPILCGCDRRTYNVAHGIMRCPWCQALPR